MNAPSSDCPCGSGFALADCCGPYLAGTATPPTAEALMRSRYTAHVRGAVDYLIQTWHPRERAAGLREDLLAMGGRIRWLGLEVLSTHQGQEGDKLGKVTFKASYLEDGKRASHQERSRFARHQGRWVYVDGTIHG